jgi:Cytochrome oxidase complex assembly protein 1
MTTKKIVIMCATVVLVIGLLIVIFVGGIVGFAFYTVGNSEAAVVAKDFLRQSEQLKQDIGPVTDFGSFVTGSVNFANSDGNATLNLKVIGERKTVNATVELIYRSGRPWRVTAASYENEAGQMIRLLSLYESRGNWDRLQFGHV